MVIAAGPIWQIGCVTEDIERAESTFSRDFGVPEWRRLPDAEFRPGGGAYRGRYRGSDADYTIRVSLGYAGSQQIELIQPLRGENLYTEYLERCGPGVHHLAWIPQDYEAALDEARVQGLQPAQSGETDEMDFVYFETPAMGVPAVELLRVSPRLTSWFESLHRSATAHVATRA